MKFLPRFLALIAIIALSSCSKEEKLVSSVKENTQEKDMIFAYEEGVKYLNIGDAFYAAKSFLNAELLYPQSDWAPKASLMAAYSYYVDDYNNDSIFQLEQFIKAYPTNKRIPYAHYLLAMSYYNKIIDQKKDIKPLTESKNKFQYIVKEYPNTDFALDAKFKLNLIEETLASKEMFIAKHYLKKEKWIPAINRLKFILKEYETTVYVEEALHRLVEINYKIGLIDESKKYANLLGYNYSSSKWYEQSYRIFNKDYDDPYTKIKKNSRLEKLKSILD